MMDDPLPLSIVIILLSLVCMFIVTIMKVSQDPSNMNHLGEDEDTQKDAESKRKTIRRYYGYKTADDMILFALFAVGIIFSLISVDFNFPLAIAPCIAYIAAAQVFGIIIPSKVARQHAERLSRLMAGPERILSFLLLPITLITGAISDILLKLFGQDVDPDYSNYSEESIMTMLEAGEKSGVLKNESKNLIGSIFRFDDEYAVEIMTPRTDVFMIDINDPQEQYLDELMRLRRSRIPVFENEYDNIIGILNIKDYLIKAREQGFGKVDIRSILRAPYFVPETKNIDSLFREMQKEKQHIAILIDEYGGFSGIATMEDIIEEIVGDIDDEYDETREEVDKIGDNIYILDGSLSLDYVNEKTGSDLKSDTSETIGGFLMDEIGEIPEDGYVNIGMESSGYEFTILSVKEKRIKKIKMNIPKEKAESEKG